MTRTQTRWVSDEVWAELDPNAGTMSRAQRRRALAVASAAVAVLIAGFTIDRSGVVQAHVDYSADSSDSGAASPKTKFFTRQVAVQNNGWTTIHVTSVGKDGPGLHLVRPNGPEGLPKDLDLQGSTAVPFDLHPGQIAIVEVAYQVTDCAAVSSDPFPVALRVDRPWGTQTVDISLPLMPAPGITNGLVPASDMIGWQKEMADAVCNPRQF
ncbi:hypothetical protein [Catenulispora rubra]|uniref:hypothetical protein n=1 Tax=Catenulispora rubra TaxID=280293 RepID=UPI001891F8C3|nr:hypothetical protein [Catenulispora rubra]